MLAPQTLSTLFDLNHNVTMDYAGAEAKENMENNVFGAWEMPSHKPVTIYTTVHLPLLLTVNRDSLRADENDLLIPPVAENLLVLHAGESYCRTMLFKLSRNPFVKRPSTASRLGTEFINKKERRGR